ncbi:MAG: hypothetical protein ABI653_05840 [Bacteroidota bacterium]
MDNNVIHSDAINAGTTFDSTETSHAVILQKLEEINNRLKKLEEHLLMPLINNEEDKIDAVKS